MVKGGCTVDHCTYIYHRRNPIGERLKLINQGKRTEAILFREIEVSQPKN